MASCLQLGRFFTALLLCATFLPLQVLVHGLGESETACALHGDNCTCPLECRREEHNHAETPAAPACHLTSPKTQSGSVVAPARTTAQEAARHTESDRESLPRWMACSTSPDEAVFGLDRLYPPTPREIALAEPGEDLIAARAWLQPLFVAHPPTIPPPRV